MGVEKWEPVLEVVEVILTVFADEFTVWELGKWEIFGWFPRFFGLSIWMNDETVTELENIGENGQG